MARLSSLIALFCCAAIAVPAAHAQPTGLVVGVGDQSAGTFADPLFQELGVRHSRLIVAWNAALVNPEGLDAWLQAARASGIEPLVAFNHAEGDRCPARPCRLPSVGQYRRAFLAFRRRHPDVRVIQPWNEANHQSQPTARSPRRAADYYRTVRRICRGCTVVAADVLDSTNMERWLARFRRHARDARLWGLHNYTDTNRFRTSGTERLLRTVPGEVWLTETGGIYRFETADGRVALPGSEARAARSIEHLFRIAASYRPRITRLYLYQWRKTNPFDRFDAGILDPEGKPRRSYHVLRRILRRGGARPLRGVRPPKGPDGGRPGGGRPGRGRR